MPFDTFFSHPSKIAKPFTFSLHYQSTVVLDILLVMQESANVAGTRSHTDIVAYLFLLGVSYSLGMYIALAIWKPILLNSSVASNILDKARSARRSRIENLMQKKL